MKIIAEFLIIFSENIVGHPLIKSRLHCVDTSHLIFWIGLYYLRVQGTLS